MPDTRHWCEGIKGMGWEEHDSDEWYEVQFKSKYTPEWTTYVKLHDKKTALAVAASKSYPTADADWRVMFFAEHRTIYKEEVT